MGRAANSPDLKVGTVRQAGMRRVVNREVYPGSSADNAAEADDAPFTDLERIVDVPRQDA